MDTSFKIVVIAALEREVAPLVKGWRVLDDSVDAAYRKYARRETAVVCAGMGARAARRAADAAVYQYKPQLLVSAGLAGALVPDLKVGDAIIPSVIINSATGDRYPTGHGSGVLVTASGMAGVEAKRLLARQHEAQLVDMEAAAVAQVAQQHGVAFTAVKAVSDEVDFDLPDLEPFVDSNGRFLTSRFISHIAFRPRMWAVVRKLAANSDLACVKLCTVLKNLIEEAKENPGGTSGAFCVFGKGPRLE
jgi:adenosylhomocysteine nucleosidase